MKQLYPGIPFIYDDNDNLIGIRNADGTQYNLAMSIPDAMSPVDGVKAALTTNMSNANADITLTAVDYGTSGNDITITYVDPGGATQSLSVTVSGKDIRVSLATNGGSAITSTANLVKAAIDALPAAAALVTVAVEGTGAGVVNAVVKASLTGGVTVTPGPIGCLAVTSANVIYRKTAVQTWTPITASLSGTNALAAGVDAKLILETGVLGTEEI
jgi:hypothetical protein